jgi:hypothetical protein
MGAIFIDGFRVKLIGCSENQGEKGAPPPPKQSGHGVGRAMGPLSLTTRFLYCFFSSSDISRKNDAPKTSAQFDVREIPKTQKYAKYGFLYCSIKNQ